MEATWLSLLPPLLAIALAIITRQVVLSLAAGVFLGALIIRDWNVLESFTDFLTAYIQPAIQEPGHTSNIIFLMLFGGMVAVMTSSGGARAMVGILARLAKTARMGQVATWLMGIVIFFDDYANTLIVGNAMRPITDKLRISREKLAYLVDTTSAPVAAVFLSSWIGFELGVINDALKDTGFTANAFTIFTTSIPYRFYVLFAIVFAFLIAVMSRDFGPMFSAEHRARTTGKLLADDAQPIAAESDLRHLEPESSVQGHWINGVLPIVTVVAISFLGMYTTGRSAVLGAGSADFSLRNILSNSDSFAALLWASFGGCLVAIIPPVVTRVMSFKRAMEAWFTGCKAMLLALMILVLAWALAAVTKELKTAEFIVSVVSDKISPTWLPMVIFSVASFTSFATGTSWGTMGILMPLVVPLAWSMSQMHSLPLDDANIFLSLSVSGVLAGSIWGDHCSPISDTTVLSSTASVCDHIDHVDTQLPYAIVVALVSIVAGYLPVALGLSVWASLGLGVLSMAGILYFFGKKV